MARIRTIKPEFFFDEDLARLPPHTRLFFIGLWTQADRDGRGEDRPVKLKAMIFPYEEIDGEAVMASLCPHFVDRYEAKGKKYFQIVNFNKHQYPNVKEPKSTIPPSKNKHHAGTMPAPCQNGSNMLDKGKGMDNGKGTVLRADKLRTKAKLSTTVDNFPQHDNFRVFMDRFLAEMLDLSPNGEEVRKKAISAAYRRFARAGRDILAMAEGDPEIAFQGVHAVGIWLQDRGLSWTLDTAAKHFLDWKADPEEFNAKGKKN